ncbi:MAG: glycosyltransferase family 2 protein [Candidatus Levyibacteriota bacterium]
MLKVFTVILTFNNEKTIPVLLDSLFPFKSRFKVIIADNRSTDKTLQQIKKYNFVKLIKNKKNLGFSAGNNVGIKYAFKKGADVIFLLNPDTVLPKNFLKNFQEGTELLLNSNAVGIIGPKIYDEKGKLWSAGGTIDERRYSAKLTGYGSVDVGQYNANIDLDYVSGTAIFIKKEVFEKIGLLKEDYFLYYEDVDFCFRAKKAGFKLAIDPNITITHNASSSVGKNSSVMQYYMARNHMLFVERFAPLKVRVREIVRLPKTIYKAKHRKYELLGIKDYLLRRFGKNVNWS